MKHFIALGYLSMIWLMSTSSMWAQPGMYTEAEIEYQTIFLEAQHAKFVGNTEEQIKLLNKLIKRNKASHAAYNELAKTYSLQGNQELAQKNAEKAHKLDPNNEWYLLALAEIYEKSEQRALAVSTYEKLQLINPDNPTIYHKLAQLQLHEKNPEGAVANLKKLQSRQGVDEESSRRIFDIYKSIGKKKEAIAALNTLIDAYPDNTRYLGNLASYYLELKDQKSANKVFEKILAIDPTDSKAALAVAKAKAGAGKSSGLQSLIPILANSALTLDDKIQELMPYVSQMKQKGATTDELDMISEKLVMDFPKEAKVHSLRGDILFYQSKFKAAGTSYKKALELDDSKYVLWQQYMQSLWEQEQFASLAKISEEAVDLYPNQVNAFLFHALGLYKSGDQGAKDFVMEAGFIAGKNPKLLTQIDVVNQWLNSETADKKVVNNLDIKHLTEPIYLELAGDLYAAIDDNHNAKKLFDEAIKLGSNAERINQKLGIE